MHKTLLLGSGWYDFDLSESGEAGIWLTHNINTMKTLYHIMLTLDVLWITVF